MAVVDRRMSDPAIEVPMIKEYASRPTGMMKSDYTKLQWNEKDPFPLEELVSNSTIKIDQAFKIENVIVAPESISCKTSTGEI